MSQDNDVSESQSKSGNHELKLLWLPGQEAEERIHLTVSFAADDPESREVSLSFDGRKENEGGIWSNQWEDGCYLSLANVKSLHRFLGYILAVAAENGDE